MTTALSIFQALADPTRLRILALLHRMELSVGELAQVLGQSQPRVSRHLKIMTQALLIARRKEGNWVFLTLGETHIVEPVLLAMESWQTTPDPEMEADRARLVAVRSVRATEAGDYFENHAAEWDAIRSLHVAEQEVETAILRLLSQNPPGRPIGRLLDIGTGTGRMIELLGPTADNATGIDRSPAMLRLARSKLDGMPRIELRQGDLYALPVSAGSIDTAIMHQVLHYAQHPGAAITEAARVLAPGGLLLIVDFAVHDRRDLREKDAHAWLGFPDERMRFWLTTAGLEITEVVTLEDKLTVRLWLAKSPDFFNVISG
ncbi:ArsR/SmtB family transcription factor [Acetobacter fallax]|uniref:Metalloregulator ArsR/SmtB family transcription factor n=1 Tax=Acetobacter fallax TaxID=1737473 RepID=A0ABX0KG87_9PROT|nr:metalloregulator ArsR/SmtB family transcription factor [Acetobacter fallax]NHO32942.1 metalloregulator ArsR/SmtB family transcription factor [Acetobacter fallax]NHO36563.1 metalloregulator ArsR/SmtB family transcription factor [Acetobacter fallax]